MFKISTTQLLYTLIVINIFRCNTQGEKKASDVHIFIFYIIQRDEGNDI